MVVCHFVSALQQTGNLSMVHSASRLQYDSWDRLQPLNWLSGRKLIDGNIIAMQIFSKFDLIPMYQSTVKQAYHKLKNLYKEDWEMCFCVCYTSLEICAEKTWTVSELQYVVLNCGAFCVQAFFLDRSDPTHNYILWIKVRMAQTKIKLTSAH